MINGYSFTLMIEMLMNDAVTKTAIREETGLHHATVGSYVRHMHRKGIVRVAEYRRCKAGRVWVPCWELNVDRLPDAKRPTRSPSAVRSAIHRSKKRAMKINRLLAGK